MYTGFWWGNLRERDHSEDPGIAGRIILSWISKKWDGGMDWIDLAEEVGTCKCNNEPYGSAKCGEFFD